MTKKEAAEFLELSVKSLEKYMSQKRIAFNHVKGKHGMEVEFTQEELERFKEDLGKRVIVASPAIALGEQIAIPTTSTISKSGIVVSTDSMVDILKEIAQALTKENKRDISSISDLGVKLTLTLNESSVLSGLSTGYLRKAIKMEQLKAAKRGKGWNIKRSDLEMYVEGL